MNTVFILLTITVLACNGQKTFFTGGGCSTINGVGSPVLMVANSHKYIMDSLDIRNKYTDVSFLYQSSTPSLTNSSVTSYKLVYAITTFQGTEYLGIQFEASGANLGSMRTERVFKTKDKDMLGAILGIANVETALATEIQCGDLKMVFSGYGRSPTPDLPYAFPGQGTGRRGSLSLLSQLGPQSSSYPRSNPKNCNPINYTKELVFGTLSDTAGTETFRCIPGGNPVSKIKLRCRVPNPQGVNKLSFEFNNIDGTTDEVVITSANANPLVELDLSLGETLHITADFGVYFRAEVRNGTTVADSLQCGTLPATPTYKDFLIRNVLGVGAFSNGTGGVLDGLYLKMYKE